VTLARSFSNTFAGVRPADAPAFIAAELAGAFCATLLFRWLLPSPFMSRTKAHQEGLASTLEPVVDQGLVTRSFVEYGR
jgi:glycerol uptake facilitator-like aquaporin